MIEPSPICIRSLGAVSPAGWGLLPLRDALAKGHPLPLKELERPGRSRPYRVRTVPPNSAPHSLSAHPRLRRTSPITRYAVAAALEALGPDAARVADGSLRLGIVLCVMTGCVNYSRRFYDETLKDPATASPLVFPETVFNAPASHLAALLGSRGAALTLVGDPGMFLQGLAWGAAWLLNDEADGCVVVGAEEPDWLTAEAHQLFDETVVPAAGAGALYLGRTHDEAPVELRQITDSHGFSDRRGRARAARAVRAGLSGHGRIVLCDGLADARGMDIEERNAWLDWKGERISPKKVLGEGLAAASAWQCVAAVDALGQGHFDTALISVVGCNQQAIGAVLSRHTE